MEYVPEYELVFLNELHEKLKCLDPRRTPVAGLYRILGRLVEHDLNRQIAKIESCFHRAYNSPSDPAENPLVKAETADPLIVDLTQENNEEHEDYQESSSNPPEMSGVIELAQVMDEGIPHPLGESSMTATDSIENSDKNRISPLPFSSSSSLPTSQQRKKKQQNHGVRGVLAPKVILRIDTQLLGSWRYEPRALFEFMGEVLYENGRWIMQARAYRNMEGLDLYTFRHSVLLTRELVHTYQERRGQGAESSNTNH
ncbi:hypothetical protein BGX34_000659 [Mortierella sp. NVP85]|nr:hypothetical protein BGX34_000659 [Mortierella sp. NVP85]